MSELPNQNTKIPIEPPLEKPVSLAGRAAFILGFVLIAGATVLHLPQIAQQIAYSWNIGAERAKAAVSREFLADNPLSAQRISWVAKSVLPGVVGIEVITSQPIDSGRYRRGNPSVLATEIGSGIIVNAEEGHVLTNHHVIEDAQAIYVRLSDGREIEAEVIGGDRLVDFAVLRITADDLEAVPWGDSRQVVVGEQVVAIGSPFGLRQTVTSGIISATERNPTAQAVQRARRWGQPVIHDYLQTDAAINFGNSGGALVDMNGKLIGICTMVITAEHGGSSGIGFAIPSYTAKQIYEKIILYGRVQHGWIGVDIAEVNTNESLQMKQRTPRGAVVRNFSSGDSPARNAGLQRGDIILHWGTTEIKNPLHLIHLVTLTKPETTESIEVYRGGEILKLEITVGERPRGR